MWLCAGFVLSVYIHVFARVREDMCKQFTAAL